MFARTYAFGSLLAALLGLKLALAQQRIPNDDAQRLYLRLEATVKASFDSKSESVRSTLKKHFGQVISDNDLEFAVFNVARTEYQHLIDYMACYKDTSKGMISNRETLDTCLSVRADATSKMNQFIDEHLPLDAHSTNCMLKARLEGMEQLYPPYKWMLQSNHAPPMGFDADAFLVCVGKY